MSIDTTDLNLMANIESRLHSKGIQFENGYKGNNFFQDAFLREPKRIIPENWCEFILRIGKFSMELKKAMNNKKCDDMFLIGGLDVDTLDLQDVNTEFLDISNFKELRYLLKLSDNID